MEHMNNSTNQLDDIDADIAECNKTFNSTCAGTKDLVVTPGMMNDYSTRLRDSHVLLNSVYTTSKLVLADFIECEMKDVDSQVLFDLSDEIMSLPFKAKT